MKTSWIGLVGLAVLASSLGGCGRTEDPVADGVASGALKRAQSCGDLEAMLKADALVKMNKQIDAMVASFTSGGGWGMDKGASLGAPEGAQTGSAGSATPSTSNDRATSFSETNTQVKGVDEADFVKNDGKYVYLLHGSSFRIVDAYPAAAMKEASSLTIDGEPSEMFVADGKVVIYSLVDGVGIYKAAGVSPRETYYDYGYGYATGVRGGAVSSGGGVAVDPAPSPTPGGAPQSDGVGTKCVNCVPEPVKYAPLLKVTVLTIVNGTQPVVSRDLYFEGSYLSSRRVGTNVRTVITGGGHGPVLKMYPEFANGVYPQTTDEWKKAFEGLRTLNTLAINNSKYSDWVPYQFERTGTAVKASSVACTDYYVPGVATTDYGLTQVAAIDLNAPTAAPKNAAIVARADTVYANGNSLYLAARGWNDPGPMAVAMSSGSASVGSSGGGSVSTPPSTGSGSSGTTPASPPSDPTPKNIGLFDVPAVIAQPQTISLNKTYLHKFDFASDPSQPVYVATGDVQGEVANQFYLDDKDGTLRVATTEQRADLTDGKYYTWSNVNHLFTLQVQSGALTKVGDAGELAKGERIYSVRYVGTRGYVVTYRQVDPLFVFDLSDPTKPTKLAELKIPGFSEYMHPLDDGHLLTIGQDIDEKTNRRNGLALQIFDVTQGTSPKLLHKYVFSGSEHGSSEAEYNHKAFTYFADKKLLSFPYYSYDYNKGYQMRSTAELFSIDITAGIKKVGAVDHTSLFGKNYYGYCGGSFSPYVRRSVFMDNTLYSISYAGIKANDTATLSTLATLALPEPKYSGGPYGNYSCGGGGSVEIPPSEGGVK